jgi:hypothetical protein
VREGTLPTLYPGIEIGITDAFDMEESHSPHIMASLIGEDEAARFFGGSESTITIRISANSAGESGSRTDAVRDRLAIAGALAQILHAGGNIPIFDHPLYGGTPTPSGHVHISMWSSVAVSFCEIEGVLRLTGIWR